MKERLELPDNDTRLSAEARLERATMLITVSTMDDIVAEAKRTTNFWATAWQALDVEEAKKKAICSKIEGKTAQEGYSRCLLASVRDCYQATTKFTNICGL